MQRTLPRELEEAAYQILRLERAIEAQNHPLRHCVFQDLALADLPVGMIPHLLIRVEFARRQRPPRGHPYFAIAAARDDIEACISARTFPALSNGPIA